MNKIVVIFFVGLVLFLNASVSFSAELSPALMYTQEEGDVFYFEKGSAKERSEYTYKIQKEQRGDKVFYKYTAQGKGDYFKYKDVVWDVEAELEERGEYVYPIFSKKIVKNASGEIIDTYDKQFDYSNNKLKFVIKDKNGKIEKQKKYSIRGHMTDGDLMACVLRTFAHNIDKRTDKKYYLISDKGKIFKIDIKPRQGEVLSLRIGDIDTIKMELIPDLGVLQEAAKTLVPPTFVWFTKDPPHVLLQYEGLEAGLGTKHVVTYLMRKEPPLP